MTFEQLQAANATIKTTNIKNKEYAEVNQRIKAYRMIYPNGAILTELLSNADGVCVFKASVTDENGNILAAGTAYEREDSSYINKTSYIENCETSAVGRALGFAGFGIDTSVASAEEVANAINQQDAMKPIDEQAKLTIQTLSQETGTDVKKILDTQGAKTLDDLTMGKANFIINVLMKKRAKKNGN